MEEWHRPGGVLGYWSAARRLEGQVRGQKSRWLKWSGMKETALSKWVWGWKGLLCMIAVYGVSESDSWVVSGLRHRLRCWWNNQTWQQIWTHLSEYRWKGLHEIICGSHVFHRLMEALRSSLILVDLSWKRTSGASQTSSHQMQHFSDLPQMTQSGITMLSIPCHPI